jgi:hypothetical protein
LIDPTLIKAMTEAGERTAEAIVRGAEAMEKDIRKFPDTLRPGMQRYLDGDQNGANAVNSAFESASGGRAGPRTGALVAEFGRNDEPMLSGFGPEVDGIIAKDPILTKRIRDLQREDWIFHYGKAEEVEFDAWTNRSQRRVGIHERYQGDPAATVRYLAHEVNHAHPEGYQPKEIPVEGRTREQWIEEVMGEHGKDEGDADIELRDTRTRILSAGGPDIGLAFESPLASMSYEKYVEGHISREEAREAIGRNYLLARPEGHDGYFDIYWSRLENVWDQAFGGTGT